MNIPKIGLGTYNHTNQTKLISYAIRCGYKLIDTAPNYNNGKSQENISKALNSNPLKKNEILICTKVGFISNKYGTDFYLNKNLVLKTDLVRNHCLSQAFIKYEVENNLRELQKETIDILFIHNPEQQLETKSKKDLMRQLFIAFETLEQFCLEGKIKYYGISSWSGFETKPNSESFSLNEIYDIAFKVNGRRNKFKFIQTPLSFVYYDKLYNCVINNTGLLKEAKKLSIKIFANSPLHNGELIKIINDDFLDLLNVKSKSLACLLFLKSFKEIDTILIGASNKNQIKENILVNGLGKLRKRKLEEILNILSYGRKCKH